MPYHGWSLPSREKNSPYLSVMFPRLLSSSQQDQQCQGQAYWAVCSVPRIAPPPLPFAGPVEAGSL